MYSLNYETVKELENILKSELTDSEYNMLMIGNSITKIEIINNSNKNIIIRNKINVVKQIVPLYNSIIDSDIFKSIDLDREINDIKESKPGNCYFNDSLIAPNINQIKNFKFILFADLKSKIEFEDNSITDEQIKILTRDVAKTMKKISSI